MWIENYNEQNLPFYNTGTLCLLFIDFVNLGWGYTKMLENPNKISCCNIECFIPKYNGLGNFKMPCIDKISDRFVFCLNNIWSEIWKCTKMAHYLELISWLFLICTLKILVFMVYFCYNMYSYSQELIFMSIEHYTYQNVQFHIHNTPHSLIS